MSLTSVKRPFYVARIVESLETITNKKQPRKLKRNTYLRKLKKKL